jgi:hypothetical protein
MRLVAPFSDRGSIVNGSELVEIALIQKNAIELSAVTSKPPVRFYAFVPCLQL